MVLCNKRIHNRAERFNAAKNYYANVCYTLLLIVPAQLVAINREVRYNEANNLCETLLYYIFVNYYIFVYQ